MCLALTYLCVIYEIVKYVFHSFVFTSEHTFSKRGIFLKHGKRRELRKPKTNMQNIVTYIHIHSFGPKR